MEQNSTVIRKSNQKYLGEKGLIAFIVMLSAVIPLSIDIYLPALPTMGKALNDTSGLINYTLIGFFVFFGLSTLIWGPISDKVGRKQILFGGVLIYIIGSLMCVLSTTVGEVIAYRILQAIGCGAMFSVSGAIVKDSFDGAKRASVMALVQSMAMLAPLIAPIVGAVILKFTSWRGIFIFLTLTGIIGFVFTLFYQETLEERHEGSVVSTFGRLIHVGKNPNLIYLIIVFFLSQVGNMAYVSSSAYIYVSYFHLSEQVYSFYFAGNAIFAILGPLLCIRLLKYISVEKLVKISLIVCLTSGVLIISFGLISPIFFAIVLIPFTFFNGMIRPLGANLMFDQQEGDAGSVSSLMNFVGILLGAVGMVIISLGLMNNITLLGILIICVSIISITTWFMIHKRVVK